MPRAVLDTTVLFAAAYRRDAAHRDGLAVLRGIDDGSLLEGIVLDYVLAETLNGLTTHAGHEAAVDSLGRIEENARLHVDALTADAFATGKALFRPTPSWSVWTSLRATVSSGSAIRVRWRPRFKNGIAPGGGTESQPDSS